MCECYFTKWDDTHSQCDLIIFWYNYPSVTSRDMSYYMWWVCGSHYAMWDEYSWRNFIILWYKSPFVTRREIFFHVWLTELEISHFIIKGFPVFARKMAWDICLHSLSMRPYSLFCRSQINTPEIISKYQRITPNTKFAHIPFRSGRKAWCIGVIFQRQIYILGIIFIHHRITPPWVCGINFNVR